MGFKDPIDAGGILIREDLQSPNYITSTSGWRIARDGTAEFVGLIIQLGGLIQMRGALANTPLFTTIVQGDAFARFIINADGGLGWGGGNLAVDTALYRQNPSVLRTDDQFSVGRPANNDLAVTTSVAGDTLDRFAVTAAGSIDFGDGSAARDTNLYRNGANQLRTDDQLQVGQSLEVGGNVGFYGTAPQAKPNVTGSRGGNAALASLLTSLANLGLITDSSF